MTRRILLLIQLALGLALASGDVQANSLLGYPRSGRRLSLRIDASLPPDEVWSAKFLQKLLTDGPLVVDQLCLAGFVDVVAGPNGETTNDNYMLNFRELKSGRISYMHLVHETCEFDEKSQIESCSSHLNPVFAKLLNMPSETGRHTFLSQDSGSPSIIIGTRMSEEQFKSYQEKNDLHIAADPKWLIGPCNSQPNLSQYYSEDFTEQDVKDTGSPEHSVGGAAIVSPEEFKAITRMIGQ